MCYLWRTCFFVGTISLCIVAVPNQFSEIAMSFVDLAHAPAKARDGEQY